MPRNPGARRGNNRHGDGLVGPGKRVTKQRSNGHLNGNPKGPAPSDPVQSTSAAASTVTPSASGQPRPTIASSISDPTTRLNLPVLNSQDSESSADGQTPEDAKHWEAINGTPMAAPRRSDPTITKPKASYEVSALQIASTILRSRPAYDTIALLIILLALPSMILTIFQAVFASLTLMPGGFSPFNFLSVFEVFQGSAGSPSLGVMLWVDMIFFGLWICLWNWAQNFALDLAQIHIAMTLGNGSSGKNGSANTICFAIVLCLHTARSQGVRRFVTTNLFPTNLLSQTRLAGYLQYLPSELDFGDTPGPPSKLRSFFAIHILSQALISFVRRRVASTQAAPNAKVSKRIESELFTNSQDASGNDTAGTSATAIGHGLPSPTPGLRDGKEKGQTAKKRRRQANSVRSKQPFWAALASTKVHVMREVEHNRGLPSVTSTPNSPFDNSQQDSIWITNVDPSSIQFEANFIPKAISGDQESRLPEDSKPFYIRINGARWHSVSVEAIEDASESEGCPAQWSGEISGLAPNCTYTCSFIPWNKDQEFASVMVKTPALEDSDLATSLAPAPGRQSIRPSSPTTTLKNSIASAETKLSEARKRLHQLKKSHRSSISKVEKDVDTLNGKLRSGADNTTTKLQQKLLQAERNAQQHKDAKDSTQSAIDTLKAIPEDDTEEHNQRQDAYQTQKALLAEANESLVKAKSEADNDLACIGGELSTIASRKERILARQAKLNEQHDRITQANAQGLNEKERREADSIRREADAARREVEMQNHISHMSQQIRDLQLRTQSNWHEIDMLEKQDMAQRQKMMLSTGPVTPEGDLPGTRPQPQSARQFAFGSVNVPPGHAGLEPPQSSPFLAYANTLPSDGRRPRSDTNRSAAAMSNFSADFDDADPIPPMPVDFEVNGRKGSGSSRGKNNGSPAGVIGGGLRSPQRGSHSPGHLPGSTTW